MRLINTEKDDLKQGTVDIYRYYYEGLETPKDVYDFMKGLQEKGYTIEGDISIEFDTDHSYVREPAVFSTPETFVESSGSIDWGEVKYLDIIGKHDGSSYSASICPGKDSGLFVLSTPKKKAIGQEEPIEKSDELSHGSISK